MLLLTVVTRIVARCAEPVLCVIVACIMVAGHLILLWLWDILRSAPRAAA